MLDLCNSNKKSKSEQPSLLRTMIFRKGWLSFNLLPARLLGDFTDAQWTLGHCWAAKDWHLVSKISTPSLAHMCVNICMTGKWVKIIISCRNNHEHKVGSYRPCDGCKRTSFMFFFSSKCSCIDIRDRQWKLTDTDLTADRVLSPLVGGSKGVCAWNV